MITIAIVVVLIIMFPTEAHQVINQISSISKDMDINYSMLLVILLLLTWRGK